MLLNLHIVNMALIDELDIDFTDGLNILTGETGAGKSIIVGSIGIGLGGKFDAALLRNPEADGLVELLFSINEEAKKALEELEIPGLEDGEVLISRRLSNGRAINRINDSTVPLAKLKAAAQHLINLHAQHESRTLMKASRHLEIVDQYMASDITPMKEKVAADYKAYRETLQELEEMMSDEAERAKRLDFISFEIQEIEEAALKPGEDDELELLYKKESNAGNIAEITGQVYGMTGYDENSSAGSQLASVVHELQSLQRYDDSETSKQLLQQAQDIDSLLNDLNRAISDYQADMEFDPSDLVRTEERLNLINSLKMKYGKSIGEIQDNLSELKVEQEKLLSFDEIKAKLTAARDEIFGKLTQDAEKLTRARKKSAKALCAEITKSLESLNFNQVQFDMEFEESDSFTANGRDNAYFMISTNVGEAMRPLMDVASGGELSRVMLAIKASVTETGESPTLVFDEIDVGISGITAERVGAMMQKLSESHQIISITHLAQIAAKADTSFVIEKKVVADKTNTNIRRLDQEGRLEEIGRLLGGDHVTDAVLASAKEMLARAK